jgi:glycosyltransferase involved in cell wall biosynthesis
MAPDTFVIVTARDEADRIGATLKALAAAFPGAELWVADDGSTDATAALARETGARVVSCERAIGKGGAATFAAREALSCARAHARIEDERERSNERERAIAGQACDDSNGPEPVFVFCDGDLGESAGRLGPLVDCARRGETDIAVAAFATRVGGGLGLAVGFARWAIRRRCGLRTRAPISGQRALRARALEDVLPFAPRFGMEVGMTIDAVRTGHRVVELELDLSHRASGRTPAGFAHRARQFADVVRVYLRRGRPR